MTEMIKNKRSTIAQRLAYVRALVRRNATKGSQEHCTANEEHLLDGKQKGAAVIKTHQVLLPTINGKRAWQTVVTSQTTASGFVTGSAVSSAFVMRRQTGRKTNQKRKQRAQKKIRVDLESWTNTER